MCTYVCTCVYVRVYTPLTSAIESLEHKETKLPTQTPCLPSLGTAPPSGWMDPKLYPRSCHVPTYKYPLARACARTEGPSGETREGEGEPPSRGWVPVGNHARGVGADGRDPQEGDSRQLPGCRGPTSVPGSSGVLTVGQAHTIAQPAVFFQITAIFKEKQRQRKTILEYKISTPESDCWNWGWCRTPGTARGVTYRPSICTTVSIYNPPRRPACVP